MPIIPPKSTPHSHTSYVDGHHTVDQMVQSALSLGFVSLGFSEHAKQHFDTQYSLNEQTEKKYIHDVHIAKQTYKGQIALYLGMERDAFSYADRSPYQYVIGSVHYLCIHEQYIAVDGDQQLLLQTISNHFGGDGLAFAKAYYQLLGEYISSYQPDIIGHADLLSKYNRFFHFFDEDSTAYQRLAFDALEQAYDGCKCLEVNTGAIARSGAPSPYPALALLQHWKKLGGHVILSSDCHNAPDLAAGYETGLAVIRKAGFESIQYLSDQENMLFSTAAL